MQDGGGGNEPSACLFVSLRFWFSSRYALSCSKNAIFVYRRLFMFNALCVDLLSRYGVLCSAAQCARWTYMVGYYIPMLRV